MNRNKLKKLIVEEVKKLLEYEYFVDDEGWATDDEGNRWFAGRGGGSGTFGLRDMPSYRYGRSKKKDSHWWTPLKSTETTKAASTTNELTKAFETAISMTKSEKTKSFLNSVFQQYKTRRKLSDKQKEVVKRIFQQVGLSKVEIDLVDSQG